MGVSTFDSGNASIIHASGMKEREAECQGINWSPVTNLTDCNLHMHQMELD